MGGFAYSDSRWLRRFSLAAAGLTVALAPLTAHADGMVDPGVVRSWIDMVNASQEAQPHWMTPIITTTPYGLLPDVRSKRLRGRHLEQRLDRTAHHSFRQRLG
jgi:hypothetical protein